MVDISDFIEEGDDENGGEAQDLVALKNCLKALADAIASTNLAVIAGLADPQAAAQRVNNSVAALKRFHDAFALLDQPDDGEGEDEEP